MYESFFGFREKPFTIVPDTRFLYFSRKHREALAHLIYGVKEKKGFVVLSGEVGTGKTTLVRALLARLDESFQTAYVFNPKLSVTGFSKFVCEDLALHTSGDSKTDYLVNLHDFLVDSHRRGKTTILIVDEAQNLDVQLFEEIRMLTNLETEKQKLLQVLLVGQPELNDHLGRPELSQLKQRVSIRYHLLPLDRQETGEYMQTRLRIAGAKRLDYFTERAVQKIYEHSGGVPRLINNICDNSLLTAFAMEKSIINEEIIRECTVDLRLEKVQKKPRAERRRQDKNLLEYSSVSTALRAILVGLVVAATILIDFGFFLQ